MEDGAPPPTTETELGLLPGLSLPIPGKLVLFEWSMAPVESPFIELN